MQAILDFLWMKSPLQSDRLRELVLYLVRSHMSQQDEYGWGSQIGPTVFRWVWQRQTTANNVSICEAFKRWLCIICWPSDQSSSELAVEYWLPSYQYLTMDLAYIKRFYFPHLSQFNKPTLWNEWMPMANWEELGRRPGHYCVGTIVVVDVVNQWTKRENKTSYKYGQTDRTSNLLLCTGSFYQHAGEATYCYACPANPQRLFSHCFTSCTKMCSCSLDTAFVIIIIRLPSWSPYSPSYPPHYLHTVGS